jgi:hypothetical protein
VDVVLFQVPEAFLGGFGQENFKVVAEARFEKIQVLHFIVDV